MDIQATIKTTIKPQPLLMGLGFALSIYLLIFLFVGLGAGKTLRKMESNLASDSITIERPLSAKPNDHSDSDDNGKGNKARNPKAQPSNKGPSLATAPIAGLYIQEAEGLLPKISPSGMTPFDGYKKPAPPQSAKPLIAIIVADFGLSASNSAQILRSLPSEVSLILSPYADHPDDLQKAARKAGHEIWLGLPVISEESANSDFGPQALSQTAGLKQNQDRFLWALSRTTGYVGVASTIDTNFNEPNTAIKNIFTDLFNRGLGYFDLNPNAGKAVEQLARSSRAPYARNIQFLERTSLKTLETIAEGRGYVIGVVQPYPNSIKSLNRWLATLEAKGFALAPVSAIAAQNKR